jgi:predicted  nucleic acid-binding Zn-ribbon protein
MPKSDRRGAVATVRTSVRRVRGEGRELMGNVQHEVRRFVKRAQAEIAIDAKALRRDVAATLQDTLKQLERRANELRSAVESRLEAVDAAARARMRAARGGDGNLAPKRLAAMERRIDGIDRRLAELTDQIHDLLPSGTG